MTRNRKPRSTHTHAEPQELGPKPVDITGKEPVLVRDWDQDSVVRAIRARQIDIIDEELAYLLEQPAWNRRAPKRFRREMFEGTSIKIDHRDGASIKIDSDITEKTLSMCRLDNLKVIYGDHDY